MDTLLEKVIGLDYKIKGNGDRWRNTEEHSSLVLDVKKQVWFWNSRGISGNPIDYLINVKGIGKPQATTLLQELSNIGSNSITAPIKGEKVIQHSALVNVFWLNGLRDRDYWYRRCIRDSTIDLFKLGKYDGYWTLPIFLDGEFFNFQCRTDIPEKKIRPWYRGLGPSLFNSSILPLVSTVYITEGPVDAILLNQEGFPAVSHTGGSGGWDDSWFPKFSGQNKIIYVADNDKAGYAAANKVAKSLGITRVHVITFTGKPDKYDVVDFFRDGNTKEDFRHLSDISLPAFEMKEFNDTK